MTDVRRVDLRRQTAMTNGDTNKDTEEDKTPNKPEKILLKNKLILTIRNEAKTKHEWTRLVEGKSINYVTTTLFFLSYFL